MTDFISPEAEQLGGVQDIIALQSMFATCEAFNALAEAEEIRSKIRASYSDTSNKIPFMYGQYAYMGSFSIIRPIANLVRQAKIDRLETRAKNLLPPDGIDY